MLVIARRKGQRIVIGADIEIIVADATRRQVKIGIVAPKSTPIMRGEVFDEIERANREALDMSADDALEQLEPAACARVDSGK
ncbi:MAG: carbon storage regulator [Polyangiaceae bacterium]